MYSYSKIVTVQPDEQGTARLQPNPVQNTFRVQLPDNTELAMLIIYNAAGILVHKQAISNGQSVNAQQLTAGMYYLQVQQGGHQYRIKMIKQ